MAGSGTLIATVKPLLVMVYTENYLDDPGDKGSGTMSPLWSLRVQQNQIIPPEVYVSSSSSCDESSQ